MRNENADIRVRNSELRTPNSELYSRLSNFTVNLGLYYNIFLSIIKTVFGIIGHSSALLADGINSASDVVYYIAVKIFLKIANKPADTEHPFGHKQMENIASIVIAAFIITTAIAIAWNSIDKIFDMISSVNFSVDMPDYNSLQNPLPPTPYPLIIIALFTFFSKIFLTLHSKKIANITKNPAIKALAADHRNDIGASLAVIIGISFTLIDVYWVDPLAGVIVSFFILKTGVDILREAANEMMDVAPSNDMIELVNNCLKIIEQNIKIDSILSHRYGNHYSLNITIAIPGDLNMTEADHLAHQLETLLIKNDENLKYVFIHYHPHLPPP